MVFYVLFLTVYDKIVTYIEKFAFYNLKYSNIICFLLLAAEIRNILLTVFYTAQTWTNAEKKSNARQK